REKGGQVIFNGGFTNAALLDPVRAEKFVVAAGLPLLASAGLMQLSAVIVGGDTGLLHLANAMGKRVVMLMKSLTTFPLQHADWVVLPLPGRTFPDIEIDRVIEACAHAFAEANPELAVGGLSPVRGTVPV
ncbi:MAG TPA: glycosyltransferase family 9 protein, partial [Candidatus Paceibacterota bacterium]|nr:glycosyltransferase family 9 protein [Candidatus Paceibacterota bacterium]